MIRRTKRVLFYYFEGHKTSLGNIKSSQRDYSFFQNKKTLGFFRVLPGRILSLSSRDAGNNTGKYIIDLTESKGLLW